MVVYACKVANYGQTADGKEGLETTHISNSRNPSGSLDGHVIHVLVKFDWNFSNWLIRSDGHWVSPELRNLDSCFVMFISVCQFVVDWPCEHAHLRHFCQVDLNLVLSIYGCLKKLFRSIYVQVSLLVHKLQLRISIKVTHNLTVAGTKGLVFTAAQCYLEVPLFKRELIPSQEEILGFILLQAHHLHRSTRVFQYKSWIIIARDKGNWLGNKTCF